MTKFNPENKEVLTYGEALSPAMEITDEADAQQYLNDYIAYTQKHLDKNPSDKTASEIARINLGYYAGYYSHDVRARVEKLFNCSHPVFGSIKEKGVPTPEEAFNAGYNRK
jgi:hypothetical protein